MKKFKKITVVLLAFILFVTALFVNSPFLNVKAKEVSELTIELVGNETVYLTKGSEYYELGAKAYAPPSTDISNNIVINSSAINNDVEGTYKVSYTISYNYTSKTIYRNVIVEDFLETYEHSFLYDAISTENKWVTAKEISDGKTLFVGSVYTSDAITASCFKVYDSDMNSVFESTYNTADANYEGCDALEDEGKYVLLSRKKYDYSYLEVYSNDGTKLASTNFNYSYSYIDKVDKNRYILTSDECAIATMVTFNENNKNLTKQTMSVSYSLSGSLGHFVNDYSYYYVKENAIRKYNLRNSLNSVFIDLDVDKISTDGVYLYAYTSQGSLYIIDFEGNIKKQSKLNDVTITDFAIGEQYIYVLTSSDKIINIVKKTLSYEKSSSLKKDELTNVSSLCANGDAKVILFGKNNSNENHATVYDFSYSISGVDTLEVELNSNVDYKKLINVLANDTSITFRPTPYSENVDTSKAGIYTVYYSIEYIKNGQAKKVLTSKDIKVLHKTSLINNETYNGTVTIDIEGAQVFIDGVEYFDSDEYSQPGDSVIEIIGENGYKEEININIIPKITGVENGATYNTTVKPSISGGTAYLDGYAYTFGTPISATGHHTLTIYGKQSSIDVGIDDSYTLSNDTSKPYSYNSSTKTFTSTNHSNSDSSTMTLTFNYKGTLTYNYWVFSEVNYDYFYIYENGTRVDFISGTTGTKKSRTIQVDVGTTLSCQFKHDSSNLYSDDGGCLQLVDFKLAEEEKTAVVETIEFTIEPIVSGIEDGLVTKETVIPEILTDDANIDIKLNGKAYAIGTPIDKCGNYELVITGTNDYIKKYSFTIETEVNGVEDGKTYQDSVTPTFTKGDATINGNPYTSGSTIVTYGLNKLVITGEGDYKVEVEFTIEITISGIDNALYIGSVTPIISGGILTLNGETYNSGTPIDVPGYYVLEIGGATETKRFNFVVDPLLNIEDGKTYNYAIIPTNTKGQLTVNGIKYEAGTYIHHAGDYKLEVNGVNGYYYAVNFTIIPGVNIVEGQEYVDFVELLFVGDAKLDGIDVQPGHVVNTIGHHQLVVEEESVITTYNFTITPDLSIFNNSSIEEFSLKYVNAEVSLNEQPYDSETIINEIGQYKLIVKGVNDYTYTKEFEISPRCSVEDGQEYELGTNLVVSGNGIQSITLNDQPYESSINEVITKVGTYTLIVTGNNDYQKSITFYVSPKIGGIEDYGYYFDSVLPTIEGEYQEVFLDQNKYTVGTPITEYGVHIIKVTGENSYEKVINFIVLPNHLGAKPGEIYIDHTTITNLSLAVTKINGQTISSGLINTPGKQTISFEYNGGASEFSFFVIPLINGVQNNKTYNIPVNISSSYSQVEVDGQIIDKEITVSEVGNHVVKILGIEDLDYSINFTIVEIIQGLAEGKEYFATLTPTISGGTLLLDGFPYTSGTEINTVGYHTLTIVGTNGYVNEIDFTVTPNVHGVESGVHEGSVYFEYDDFYIDGTHYENIGVTINKTGKYKLYVYGTNDYEYVYEFIVKAVIDFEETTYIEKAILNVTNNYKQAELDDVIVKLPYTCNTFGNHTLKIYGENDYVEEFHFSVEPKVEGVEDGATYTSGLYIKVYGEVDVYFDERKKYPDFYDNTIGNHELKIITDYGYSKVIKFTIIPNLSIEENGIHRGSFVIELDAYDAYLNDEFVGRGHLEVTKVGNHTLTIKGTGDYSIDYHFTVEEDLRCFINNNEYTSVRLTGLTGADLKLDGEYVAHGYEVKTAGLHYLTILGVGDYEKLYQFTIKGSVTVSNNKITTNGVNTYVNGEPIRGNEKLLTLIGYNDVTVVGLNGYTYSEKVLVEPKLSISHNGKYNNSVIIENINATVSIDGVVITEDTRITKAGVHTIVVEGINGYSREYKITVVNKNVPYGIVGGIVAAVGLIILCVVLIRRRRVI